MTTITDEQRQRLINAPPTDDVATQEHPVVVYRQPRSGVLASLIGMLAALGVLTILAVVTASIALVSGADLDLVGTDTARLAVALAVIGVIILVSTLVGGFVAGRVARYRGMATGLGSSLWLLVVLAVFAGLALLVNEFSPFFEGFDVAQRVAALENSDLALTGAIAAGGLLLLGLGMGLLGGRLGETERSVGAHEVVSDMNGTG
ncbi:MAG TPA: hypothetical protein VEB69_07540 [Acidimicrobiia bacterium]|nr:hypothetical protein [Acidimicrobiia bacterium]